MGWTPPRAPTSTKPSGRAPSSRNNAVVRNAGWSQSELTTEWRGASDTGADKLATGSRLPYRTCGIRGNDDRGPCPPGRLSLRVATMTQSGPEPFDFDGFRAQGFHVWPRVFPDAAVARTIAHGMALAGARRGDFAPAMQPHREDPALLELMRDPAVVAVVEA